MSIIDRLDWLGKALAAHGLVLGSGGNISARDAGRMIISPSGHDVDRVAEWSVVDLESGEAVSGPRAASEWELHRRALRVRPEARFVCHAHPPWAIGLISGGRDLQAYTPDFVAFVDRVEHVDYVVPAGPALARAVEAALGTGAPAVGLRNHGFVTLGRTAREALVRMRTIEDAAKTQLAAIAAGHPRPLSPAEQDAVRNLAVEAYRRGLLGDDDGPSGEGSA